MDQAIVNGAIVSRYLECMSVFEDKGQLSITSTLEMWNALLEIYTRKLWVARFNTTEEWIEHIDSLGYTGLSRSNIYAKLNRMKMLMVGGVKQEIAAAAVVSVPGAVFAINSSQELLQITHDKDPNEYLQGLLYMTPGDAIRQVREDKGQKVEMWFHDVKRGVRPGEVIGVIVRSDSKRGYTSYDFKATITPQIPGNADLLEVVANWAVDKIKGHWDIRRMK